MSGVRAKDATTSLLDEARAALTAALVKAFGAAAVEPLRPRSAPLLTVADGERPGFRGEHLVSLAPRWPAPSGSGDRWSVVLDRLRAEPVVAAAVLEGGVLRLTLGEAAVAEMLARLASCPGPGPERHGIDRWSTAALDDEAAFSELLARRAHLSSGEPPLARVMRVRLGARRERRFAGEHAESSSRARRVRAREADALERELLGLDDLLARPAHTTELARALHATAGTWLAVVSAIPPADTPAIVHAATAGALECGLGALGMTPWTLV